MKESSLILALCFIFLSGCSDNPARVPSTRAERTHDISQIAAAAAANRREAIAELRETGQAGLDALLAVDPALVQRMRDGSTPLDDQRAAALRSAIDAVARQRDAHVSGLYWFTDLELAKTEAVRTGRHILSLRLLGNLDEEYSCANSRFFRTALYANVEIAKYLREHYVLHWKSVRPAPLVTIDMGDGRRLKRTITGNSIHYILDADGTVLDALPGLYGSARFLEALKQSENLGDRPMRLRLWHGHRADALCLYWLSDAVRCGMYGNEIGADDSAGIAEYVSRLKEEAFPRWRKPVEPPARRKPSEFEPLAAVKSMVERPISQRTSPVAPVQPVRPANAPAPTPSEARADSPAGVTSTSLAHRMSAQWWQKIAALHSGEVRLDESSRRLMMAKLPRDSVRADERIAGAAVDANTPFARMLRRFEAGMALDTVRNEYLFHTQIHQWLEEDETDRLRVDVEALNKRVYAELFLTPDYDAWLGLVPDDTYTALEKDGCACDKGARPMQ